MRQTSPVQDTGQYLQIVHQGMVRAGLDVNAIYARLGYDAEKLAQRELRTPHQQQAFFWETVEAVTADPDIGLHLCPHLPLFRGDVIEYLMFSSRTFGDGMTRAFKYLRLVSDALHVRLLQDAQGTRLAVIGSSVQAPQLRHTEICVLYEIVQFARSVTGAEVAAPRQVRLRCSRRSPAADYERVFGCPVEFDGAESEIWFDPALLDLPSPRWDPDLLHLHEELAEKRLTGLKRQDLVARVRAVFAERLELENCELEDVARYSADARAATAPGAHSRRNELQRAARRGPLRRGAPAAAHDRRADREHRLPDGVLRAEHVLSRLQALVGDDAGAVPRASPHAGCSLR